MNAKQFVKLIVVLLLVGGVGFLLVWRQQKLWKQSESALGGKVLPDFPLNEVTSIAIKDADNELTLAKHNEIWTVKDRWNYPADFSKIGDLLQSVWDLKIAQKIEAGPKQRGRFQLIPPGEGEKSGTLLSFGGKDEQEVASLLLGKPNEPRSSGVSQFSVPAGRFVLAGDENVVVVSETFSSVEADPKSWLDKDFFKVEKLQSAKVDHPEEADSWHISRDKDGEDMELDGLAEDEELDSTKTYSLKNILSSPSFSDIVNPEAADEVTGMNQPISAALKTFDGFTYVVKIGKPDENENDSYPITFQLSADIPSEREAPEGESAEDKERLDKEFKEKNEPLEKKLKTEEAYQKWTYLVSKWTIDALLNKRSDLVKEKESEAADEGETVSPTPGDSSAAKEPETPSESGAPEETTDDVEAIIDEIANPLPVANP